MQRIEIFLIIHNVKLFDKFKIYRKMLEMSKTDVTIMLESYYEGPKNFWKKL